MKVLTLRKFGTSPTDPNPFSAKIRKLEEKMAGLEKELGTMQMIPGVHGKVRE